MVIGWKATRSAEPSQFTFARPGGLAYRSPDMHTVASLRRTLGLQTTNQVRNRIDAIKDVLSDHLRRGPNNQILLTDEGVECLRQLQELYDSGLTMTEASDVLRAKSYTKSVVGKREESGFVQNDTKPSQTARGPAEDPLVEHLRAEVAELRARVAFLEARSAAAVGESEGTERAWWEGLRGEIDGA